MMARLTVRRIETFEAWTGADEPVMKWWACINGRPLFPGPFIFVFDWIRTNGSGVEWWPEGYR